MIILHGDNYRGDENLWPETLEGIFKRDLHRRLRDPAVVRAPATS